MKPPSAATPTVPDAPSGQNKPEGGSAPADQPPPAKKRRRGQNKHRPRPATIPYSEMLCSYLYSSSDTSACPFGEKCKNMHDIPSFMQSKPPDISETCYLFETYGKCTYGRACRFGSKHLTQDCQNIVNDKLYNPQRPDSTINVLSKSLQEKLRKRTIELVRSESYLKQLDVKKSTDLEQTQDSGSVETAQCTGSVAMAAVAREEPAVSQCTVSEEQPLGAVTDEGTVKLRPSEKKKVVNLCNLYLESVHTNRYCVLCCSLTLEESCIWLH